MVTPRVTVLMPVYNAERFLAEAIESILNQSFRHFEFLIIDDGSTDNTVAIVQSFTDPRIRLVRNERNLGITPTLNKGIALACCELIARMDADDTSHSQRLQKQFGYMKRNPECALLSTWARVISDDNEFIRLERYRSNFYYYNLTFECWMFPSTIMFRKSAVMAVGMYNKPYSEDCDLVWRMSTRFLIGNLAEPLVDYRVSSTRLNNVLKKSEYEIANQKNVLRNIRYYMGEGFQISQASLECLRHNFRPIVRHYNLQAVVESLAVLDAITQKMLETQNANRDVRSIRRARYFKRKFILNELGKTLPLLQSIPLLVRTQAWMVFFTLMKNFIRWYLKEKITLLLSQSIGTGFKTISSQGLKNS